MASKLQEYRRMSEEAQRQLTGSLERWQSFLATASRLYKYPYHEQVMIHAQRPDATACAEFEVWNNTMRRYVRRGSKGIALIDTSGDRERLRYVFDVSDTGTRPNSRSLNLWELREKHIPTVSSMLEKNYGVPAGESLAAQLEAVASQLAREYWEDNRRDILGILEDSFLEEYDEFNVGAAFRNAAEVSISYSLMLRCGLEPENYFEHEDFMSVFDFNTPETAGALGTAVSGINQQVLREIGAAIRNYEREQIAERSMAHGNDVQAERRLSDPGHQAERTGDETHREVRPAEEAVSEGTSPDPLEPSGAVRTAVSAPGGDRRDGAPEAGRADAAAGETGRRDGGTEAQRPAEMGGDDEYAEGAGRGDYSERTGVQLTAGEPEPPEELNSGYPAGTEYEQLSLNLFLSEQEQISQIDEADRTTEVPSAFSFAQSEIDDVLRFGSNTSHAREHIADAFQKQKPIEEIAALLQREFHGGYGIRGEHGDYAAWYDGDGIHLHKGREARYAADSQIIAWETAAERIGQLLEEGGFASNVELAEAGGRVRSELAQNLLYLKHDLSEAASRLGYFSSMDDLPAGYPDATAALSERMADSAFADTLRGEFLTFLNDYAENRGLLRFHYHRMDELWQGLKDISVERRVYPDSLSELTEPQGFITEDEISEALTGGSSVEGGKGRIYAFFTADHTMKEKADFLKQEYGIGGRSHALSGADHSSEDHSAKGIKLTKSGCTPVELNWTKVAERITSLIRKDRYFTQEQKDAYEQMHNEPEISEAEEPVQEGPLSEPANAPKPVTADEISDALIRWNSSFESKSRVNDYMLAHGRERGAAAWLKNEFGGGETFSVITDHGALELPWAKVQRQLGILVNDGRFFTEADRMLAQAEQISAQVAENDAMDVQPDIALPEDAESTEMESVPHFQDDNDLIGAELTLDGRRFAVDEVRDGRASLRDITFQNGTGFPIFRNESVETVRRLLYPEQTVVPQVNLEAELTEAELELLRPQLDAAGIDYLVANAGYNSRTLSFSSEHYREVQDMLDALPDNADEVAFSAEMDAVYPAEQTGLPYDIVTERLRTEPEHTPPVSDVRNFRITDSDLGVGGAKTKYQANINAIRLLKQLEAEGLQASHEQQEVLSRYVGWGGLADAFDPDKENWRAEYAELKELLTPDEYEAARASTLNAHYTSPTVIHAMYEALENMGFKSGNILEPSMGVGNFFGCLPESMQNSRLYGVELDSITGRIAKQLYPKADITVAGYETTDRRDFFDVAIGNVPFGQYQVNDRAYNKLGFSIHDYFFAKTLDQIRPGGVIAFVTSRYTMDKQSPEVRRYIAQRAELLGAIRLPNNAFKANAGTDVVSDIIFLQRRDRPIEIEPDWVHLGRNEDGFAINSYFVEHPEMILGRQSSESTQYGRQDFTVEPIEGLELADQLHDAVKHIRGTYQAAELPELGDDEALSDSIPADPNVKNYSYTVVDGEVYYRQNSLMSRPVLNATAAERVKGLVELRDCLHNLIDLQMDAMTPDSAIRQAQAELNTLYDSFTAKYGLINSRANALAFQDDSSYYLLCTLEELDEEKQLKRKADIFTKRTIKPHEVVTSVDTPSEALALSISEKACVDLPYMQQLTGMDEPALIAGLQGVIFRDPVKNEWQTADEYLSGNVRQKLREAEQAAAADPAYLPNVEALRASQPKDLDASEIEVRLGATWIDQKYIQQFMEETFEPPFYLRRNIQVHFSPFTAEWSISGKSSPSYSDVNAYMTYGTERANAYKILEDTLNLRDVRIYDTVTDPDGKERRVLNSKETTLAHQKQQAIRDAFQEWIWRDPDRRAELVQRYNELFNSNRPREYDGSHITFSGMNPEIHLREHQLNAVAHILYGGNTLLAHEVGAGKTFEMVAAAMESKRLGLCHKPMFVVPNHLTEQWASEFLRLYPSANILAATKKDFEPKNRKKFCARIATGDYDAIIIGHSQFERIPVSMERQERLLREQIEEVTEGIEELKSSRAERFTIKSMERTKKGLETKLKKLLESGRKDDVVTFEELGVDRLYVDEAHAFKNLFLYTKMRNVAGLSTTDAQKSSDMLLKCRYIDELTGGKGVVFATGTPVSNSMTELYTMMRYLQHDTLQKKGLAHFDCWASTFGETTTAIELAPEGTGYRARTRFAKFFNLPELMTLFKEVADIKTSDQLHLPVPEAVYHNVVAQPTEIQQAMVQELSERAARVHAGAVDASVDNMLRITTDGRKLGLDQRIINPDLPDDPSSKVNMCVDNIYRIWDEGQADRLTQLVFCDLSTPKTGAPAAKAAKAVGGNLDNPELHAVAGSVKDDSPEPEFTVYDDIREKLVSRGIPREQIAFIHEANTEARKKELFAKVRSGQVRVLMGSTFKMGAGMNVQDRLVALHDLDAPWRPGDLEQRSGRIIRQGNMNKEVHIFRYVTEATFDAYLWQTLENKQKFISQIMTSKSPVRSCEDIDETALSYAEIKALCAGDERIKEKMDLDVDVARLKLMKANHQSQQYRLEDNILRHFPEQIEQNRGFIEGFKSDMQTLAEHPHPQDGFAGMTVRGDVLTDKENAGAALVDAMKEVKGLEPVPIGSYRGFQMSLTLEDFGKQYVLTLKGKMSHRVELGRDPRGNLIRIDNALAGMETRLARVQEKLDSLYAQMETAKAELGKPFPQEQELKEKSARLAQLNIELNIDDRTPIETMAEVSDDEPEVRSAVSAKSERSSVLAKLHAPLPQRDSHLKQNETEKEVR